MSDLEDDRSALDRVARQSEENMITPAPEELLAIEQKNDTDVRRLIAGKTRRSFLVAAGAAALGVTTWKWLNSRPAEDGLAWPFRRSLDLNESLAESYFSTSRLSRQFEHNDITSPRINGHIGLAPAYDVSTWKLTLTNVAGASAAVVLSMDDILALPRREMITELRCIEGWSIVVKWTGARLSDLMARYPPPTRDGSKPDLTSHPGKLVRYVSMETPGREYYVGLDMPSALHPQTLLAYALNDTPLNWHHGAPLRLAIPVKYGIKNIKRLTTIRYSDVRPADFWGERGYDWYAGH